MRVRQSGHTVTMRFDADDPVEDEWSFDLEDIAPETETLGEGALDAAELERLEQERLEQQRREEEVRTEAQREADEAGRQRRQNVRVMVQYPLTLNVNGHPSAEIRTRDLSATGFGFATRIPLAVEDTGMATIKFDDWTFNKRFIVKFVKPIIAGRICGVQFDQLTEDEREQVVKEVFAVQRAQIQSQKKPAV
jgi:hypothetical protein